MNTKHSKVLETVSLADTLEKLEVWNSANRDLELTAPDLRFKANNICNSATIFNPYSGQMEDNPMSDEAFKQLSNRMNVPGHWAIDEKKCEPELREMVMNFKLERNEEPWFVRFHGEQIRAFLSSYYQTYDHLEFMRTVDAILANMELSQYARVARLQIDDQMRLWVVFPGYLNEADSDEKDGYDGLGIGKVYPGIYISNSETGRGSVSVSPGMIRAVCSNGLIFWKEEMRLTRVHVSLSSDMHSIIADNIQKSLELAQTNMEAMLALRGYAVKRPKIIIDNYSKQYRLPLAIRTNWYERAGAVGENLTMWDMINIATEISQDQSFDMAETMERMAGDMVMAYANNQAKDR